MNWAGCGKTALVVIDDGMKRGPGSAADSMVNEFTDNGGSDYLLEIVAGLGDGTLGRGALLRLLGEDEGPGERSGLCELLGGGEVGTVVLPTVSSDVIYLLEDFALWHPRVLLCCSLAVDGGDHGRSRPSLDRPLPNLVLLGESEGGAPGAAALAGHLDARDFFPLRTPTAVEYPGTGIRGGTGREEAWLSIAGKIRELACWRRWQGLYRSLDEGTRWTVFEFASDAMVRRLERELRAFLYSLSIDGFLPFRNGFDLRVAMEASEAGAGESAERRLSVDVRAGLDPDEMISVGRVFSRAPGHEVTREAVT